MTDRSINRESVENASEVLRVPWYHMTVTAAARALWIFFVCRFRFSLKSFIVVVTALILCLSTYRLGRQQGFEGGFRKGVSEESARSQRIMQQVESRHLKQWDAFNEFHLKSREMDR